MPFKPLPPQLNEHGGTDLKRTQYENPELPPESKEALETRWQPKTLAEQETAGSFFAVKGTNSIAAKDTLEALEATATDRTAPGRADVSGHNPFTDAV